MKITFAALAALIALTASLPCRASITTLNLTTAGSSAIGTADLGGTFQVVQIDSQSTGSGVIDPFVRIQRTGEERGYNTSLGTPLDDKSPSDGFTRALLLSEIPVINIGGTAYRQFLLDVNENQGNGAEILSLSQIQFFIAASDQLHTGLTEATPGTPSLIAFNPLTATEVFRMSANSPNDAYNEILLNYALNAGSGSGDMFLYVASSLFGTGDKNVIMYSHFGDPPGGSGIGGSGDDSVAGFEEWAVLEPGPAGAADLMPEPTSMLAWALGLACCGALRLSRKTRSK